MASRSLHNLTLAREEILLEYPEAEVLVSKLDLASLDSVEDFAYRVSKNFDSIDVLVCNAGVFRPKGRRDTPETKDGLERQFQVNFLSHFLLTELIREKIQNGKVINMMCRSMQNGGT